MKKILSVFVSILTLCVITGCTSNGNFSGSDLKKDYHSLLQSEAATSSLPKAEVIIPEIDNETPYQDLLTQEIDIHDFMQKYCIHAPYGSGDIEEIAADIGIECLRETEAGALYSIHKVKQGGLLYIFYLNERADHRPVIRCFYLQKKLSSSDFAAIKAGSELEDIKKIDPTAQIWENIYYADPEWWETSGGCATLHYLTDGILEIGFKKEGQKLKVFAKQLTDDFEMPQFTGKSYPYNGKILDQDWVE